MRQGPNDDKVICFGKRVSCPDRAQCELGEPCLNEARESADDLHYQYQHISVPQMEYDPSDDDESDPQENAALKAYFNAEANQDEPPDLQLDGIRISTETLPVVLRVLERIADYYFHTPHVFASLMHKVFKDKGQSDLARENHVTRQCVNKRLLQELGIAQKRNDIQARRDRELEAKKREFDFLASLPERHLRIFRYRFEEGLSAKETAEKVKCDIRTVFRVSQDLRRVLEKNVIHGVQKNKKIEKK